MSPGLADSRRAVRWRLIRLARWLGLGRLSEWTRLAWQRRSRSHVDLGGVRLRVGAHLSPVIQRAIYGGYYEAPELACLQRALKSSETVMLGPGSGRRAFYVDRDFWRSSTVRGSRPVREMDVPVWAFNGELERRRPTVLIIDIEGGEAELIEYMRLDRVRTVIIELHPRFIGVERTAAVKAFFAAAGFTTAASEGKGTVLWLERGGVSPEGSG